MDKWHRRYLELATLVASWSKDPSTKVGACIIDKNGNPVSFGFNGFPRGMADTPERLENREFKYPHTIHSELNCILFSGSNDHTGSTIFVTHPPCGGCLTKMKQVKLTNVVCLASNDKHFQERWQLPQMIELAEELGITITFYDSLENI